MLKQAKSTSTRAPWRLALMAAWVVVIAGGQASATTDPTLEAGFRAMYALDFPSAGRLFGEYKNARPSDPIGYAVEATCLVFSEFNRLKVLEAEFEADNKKFLAPPAVPADTQLKRRILELSERTQQLAEARLRQDPADEGALFALALTNGILGDYTAHLEHRYWSAAKYGRQGDEFARKLLQHNPQFYDAYIWTGVTNYIYGSLPLPVRWPARLFGLYGDKSTGVANLRLAAEKGQYLKPYAKILLSITYLRENNKPAAAALLTELSSEFPTNGLFAAQAKRLGGNGM